MEMKNTRKDRTYTTKGNVLRLLENSSPMKENRFLFRREDSRFSGEEKAILLPNRMVFMALRQTIMKDAWVTRRRSRQGPDHGEGIFVNLKGL